MLKAISKQKYKRAKHFGGHWPFKVRVNLFFSTEEKEIHFAEASDGAVTHNRFHQIFFLQ